VISAYKATKVIKNKGLRQGFKKNKRTRRKWKKKQPRKQKNSLHRCATSTTSINNQPKDKNHGL